MWWKDFLYFQRGSKVAVILLLILIMLTLIFNAFIININSSEIVLQHNDSIINEFEAISIQRRNNTQSGNYANSKKISIIKIQPTMLQPDLLLKIKKGILIQITLE